MNPIFRGPGDSRRGRGMGGRGQQAAEPPHLHFACAVFSKGHPADRGLNEPDRGKAFPPSKWRPVGKKPHRVLFQAFVSAHCPLPSTANDSLLQVSQAPWREHPGKSPSPLQKYPQRFWVPSLYWLRSETEQVILENSAFAVMRWPRRGCRVLTEALRIALSQFTAYLPTVARPST